MKKRLRRKQRFEIYNKYHSGLYYLKELASEYNVSTNTIKNIVKEVEKLIEKKLGGI